MQGIDESFGKESGIGLEMCPGNGWEGGTEGVGEEVGE